MRSKEQESGVRFGQNDWLLSISREEQLLALGDPDRDQVSQTDRLERLVGGGDLTFAAVDQDQIREGAAVLDDLAVAALHHLAHGGEVVWDRRL